MGVFFLSIFDAVQRPTNGVPCDALVFRGGRKLVKRAKTFDWIFVGEPATVADTNDGNRWPLFWVARQVRPIQARPFNIRADSCRDTTK